MNRNWTTKDLADFYVRNGLATPEEAIALAAGGEKPEKKNKFNARAKVLDGVTFHSTAEALFYRELKGQLAVGAISDLELQPRFVLQDKFTDGDGKKVRKMEYVGDFQFRRYSGGASGIIVADVKSRATMTPAARLKHKLFRRKFSHITLELWARSGNEWVLM